MTVSWEKICKPISDGGLGFKDLSISNLAFLKKMTWDIYTKNNWATSFIRNRFLLDFATPKKPSLGSTLWPNFKSLLEEILEESRWLPGENSNLDFWRSNWLGEPIVDLLKIPPNVVKSLKGKIKDFWNNGWTIPEDFTTSDDF